MWSGFINIEMGLALYYLVGFIIAVALLSGMRKLAGLVSNVSATAEISQKDNQVFGVSLTGALLAASVMLMGVVSSDAGVSLANEAFTVILFGLVGIVLMWVTRIVFDRVSFPHLSIHQQIMNGNMAVIISFIASLVIMSLATLYRIKTFERRHQNGKLHTAIEQNNIALALRFGA